MPPPRRRTRWRSSSAPVSSSFLGASMFVPGRGHVAPLQELIGIHLSALARAFGIQTLHLPDLGVGDLREMPNEVDQFPGRVAGFMLIGPRGHAGELHVVLV